MHVYIGPYGPTDMYIHAPILYTANDGNNKQIQTKETVKTATKICLQPSMVIRKTGTLYSHHSEPQVAQKDRDSNDPCQAEQLVDNHNPVPGAEQQRTPEEGPQSKSCQHQQHLSQAHQRDQSTHRLQPPQESTRIGPAAYKTQHAACAVAHWSTLISISTHRTLTCVPSLTTVSLRLGANKIDLWHCSSAPLWSLL